MIGIVKKEIAQHGFVDEIGATNNRCPADWTVNGTAEKLRYRGLVEVARLNNSPCGNKASLAALISTQVFYGQFFAALPPDVREVLDLPEAGLSISRGYAHGLCPGIVPEKSDSLLRKGRATSAHRWRSPLEECASQISLLFSRSDSSWLLPVARARRRLQTSFRLPLLKFATLATLFLSLSKSLRICSATQQSIRYFFAGIPDSSRT